MTFQFNAPKNAPRSDAPTTTVDWDAMNEMVFLRTTAGKVKSIPGYITGLYSLGTQTREDAEEEANPSKTYPEGATFFDKGGKSFVRFPRRPVPTVAIAVDIPSWTVDYGPFFGNESNPTPYRALLNNTWAQYDDALGKKVQVVTGYPLTEIKHDNGRWAFAKNSTLHKLAEACDLLDAEGFFTKDRVGELLGKSIQLQVQVSLNPSKDGTRKYLTEKVKIAGVVPEGLVFPELDESLLHGLNFFGDNDPEMVKKIRKVVKDTVKRAIDYDQSDIKKVLEQIESTPTPNTPSNPPAAPSKPAPSFSATPSVVKPRMPATAKPAPVAAASWEDDDSDDTPF